MGRGLHCIAWLLVFGATTLDVSVAAPEVGETRADGVALYRGARALEKSKQCRPALSRAQRALKIFATHAPPLHTHVAKVQSLRARCAKALKRYRLLLKIERARLEAVQGSSKVTPRQRAKAYQRVGRAHAYLKEYRSAIPAFDRALAALNGVANAEETLIPRLLGWRGKAYLNSGQPEKALADLTTYARYARTHHANDPAKLSKGLGLLKTAHYRLKQYPRALEILAEEEKAC